MIGKKISLENIVVFNRILQGQWLQIVSNMTFAEFLTTLGGNSAHAGSTDLDSILHNTTLHVLFYDLTHPIFFELQKCYVLLTTDTHTQIRKSGVVR